MAAPFDLSKPNRTIHAGVVLMNSETEILDVAPIDLLNAVSKNFVQTVEQFGPDGIAAQALDIEIHWVNETGKTAKLTGGLSLQPTDNFSTCPPLDIVLMGAHLGGYTPNEAELDFVRKSYENCSAFITICAGLQAAFEAGLFKNKTVAAPRFVLQQLRAAAPETNWVEKRWHRDGKLWTSGALLNGLEVMRAFGTEYWGGEGTLVQYALDSGHWPHRDVDYSDAPTKL
ncbi:uncharacterized protein Z520_01501 [Fonsecaea multimorphosa CBS 102226]|uniref:DJ-1/PfpI domain-containing protein n=1 Tax=Fonsecaea multimorphosa CBS 102226 TaxID=1442371 RepID=A0A0D2KHV6_9EURO|nr:uncharacterized protein Z520_01501 [Fonsecaea multimorphosa CBS 102226]KIY03035.1 hypothetical protein Z520_01501 [Fonsecaea multimorphosa CBS 102226]OAL30630.1 hypothetical protein AYO22_01482 [Fonsecaea multimorphosa]